MRCSPKHAPKVIRKFFKHRKKVDLKLKQKPGEINVTDFILAQLPVQYRLFGILFHIQTNCSLFA